MSHLLSPAPRAVTVLCCAGMVAGLCNWTMNSLASPPSSNQQSTVGGGPRDGRSKSPFQDQAVTLLQELQDYPACTPSSSSKTSFYWPPSAELCTRTPPAQPPQPAQPKLPTSTHASAGNLLADDPFDCSFGTMPLATPHKRHVVKQQAKCRLHAAANHSREQGMLRSGYRRRGCRSRPSSNESLWSCESAAGAHAGTLHQHWDGARPAPSPVV